MDTDFQRCWDSAVRGHTVEEVAFLLNVSEANLYNLFDQLRSNYFHPVFFQYDSRVGVQKRLADAVVKVYNHIHSINYATLFHPTLFKEFLKTYSDFYSPNLGGLREDTTPLGFSISEPFLTLIEKNGINVDRSLFDTEYGQIVGTVKFSGGNREMHLNVLRMKFLFILILKQSSKTIDRIFDLTYYMHNIRVWRKHTCSNTTLTQNVLIQKYASNKLALPIPALIDDFAAFLLERNEYHKFKKRIYLRLIEYSKIRAG